MARQTLNLRIAGMTCQGCADGVRLALKKNKAIHEVTVDWKTSRGMVVFDPEVTSKEAILGSGIFGRGAYSAQACSCATQACLGSTEADEVKDNSEG